MLTPNSEKAARGKTATLPCKSLLGVELGSSCSSGAMLIGRFGGRCNTGQYALFFLLALLFDAVGLTLLLLGILASLNYWDFLVYTGALIIAFSLLFWITWYVLNIKVPLEKLYL